MTHIVFLNTRIPTRLIRLTDLAALARPRTLNLLNLTEAIARSMNWDASASTKELIAITSACRTEPPL